MPSVQRFLGQHNNRITHAAAVANSVRPSHALERTDSHITGGGNLRLTGSYSGHEAQDLQAEIMAGSGSTRASTPHLNGVGNGQLTILGVDSTASLQTITLTLTDLGQTSEHAGLDLRENRIIAKTLGSAGNQIRITVIPQLQRAPTDYALLEDWGAGSATRTGEQWNFGALPLSAREELDPASPRIQFGTDPQTYRPWRHYKEGAWHYGLSPAPERTLPQGAPIHAISGGYQITVTDGSTLETYGDTSAGQTEIVTYYDLLCALQTSNLVEVAGIVVADRTASGQAAIDVPLVTQSWLHSSGGKIPLHDITIPTHAPTQNLTIRCINADTTGRERWSVTGDISGQLPIATTGIPYESTAAHFTVPLPPQPDTTGEGGEWSFKYQPAARPATDGIPSVCIRPFRLGKNAKARSVTFRYQPRPPADCKCSDMPTPRLSLACLGLTDGDDMSLDPEYQTRLKDLYVWRSAFITSNTMLQIATSKWSRADMDFADAVVAQLSQALGEIWQVPEARAVWDAQFSAMQSDLQFLYGLEGANIQANTIQQADVGRIWQGAGGNYFICLKVDVPNPLAYDPIYSIAPGWIDPASPLWNTSGTPFTLQQFLEAKFNGFPSQEFAVTYQCISNGKDLPEATLTEQEIAQRHTQLLRRYAAQMDYVRTLAGIVPKSDPSSTDAGGCWVDHGDSHWWVDTEGHYLPAFTNQAYISARRDTESGKAYSTMEFGFGLVVACPERLIEGDQITIRIGSVDNAKPYQVGDEAHLATVHAAPAWLAGGIDGNDTHTWSVTGSQSGPLPDWPIPTNGSPIPPYHAAGIQLALTHGGIPWELGDTWSLALEAGHWRWRAGNATTDTWQAWSAAQDIPAAGPATLPDGLQLHFDAGIAPSFQPGDRATWHLHQPHAASHLCSGNTTCWAWDTPEASVTLDLGSAHTIQTVALARWHLPASAIVQLQTSQDGTNWAAPITILASGAHGQRSAAVHFLAQATTARYLRAHVEGTPQGGALGWLWAGQPLALQHHASDCARQKRWAIQRGDHLNPTSLYRGTGDGWRIQWDANDTNSSALLDADLPQLLALLDGARQTDTPFIFVPHWQHPEEASLVRAEGDALDIRDEFAWQTQQRAQRLFSCALTLEPVYA